MPRLQMASLSVGVKAGVLVANNICNIRLLRNGLAVLRSVRELILLVHAERARNRVLLAFHHGHRAELEVARGLLHFLVEVDEVLAGLVKLRARK